MDPILSVFLLFLSVAVSALMILLAHRVSKYFMKRGIKECIKELKEEEEAFTSPLMDRARRKPFSWFNRLFKR